MTAPTFVYVRAAECYPLILLQITLIGRAITGSLRIFSTSTRERFRATSFASLSSPEDMAAYIEGTGHYVFEHVELAHPIIRGLLFDLP